MNKLWLELGPLWRALMRNKIGVLLIALQIAFTMAVCINAYAMIKERLALMARPSGLAEAELFHLSSTGISDDFAGLAVAREDLATIRSTPGIRNAVQINAIPMSGSGWSMGLATEPGSDNESTGVATYMVDEHGLDTLGVKLLAGSNFTQADVVVRESGTTKWPGTGILTLAAAQSLFPDVPLERMIGRFAYIDDTQPIRIKGVIEYLQAPWSGSSIAEQSLLVPSQMDFQSSNYLVRTQTGQRDAMVSVIEEQLAANNSRRIVRNVRTMDETRKRSYQLESGLTRVLQFVMIVLLFITACGVLGLASFSVRRRTKQIGTRRALGASKGAVLRYFLLESALVSGIGVVAGALLSVGINLLLVAEFEFPKIAWVNLPVAMLGLVTLGLVAAFGPARRACNISPAVATRTV